MVSPACEVKDGSGSYAATTDGVDVTVGHTITIRLADPNVDQWEIQCITTDDANDAATIQAGLTIDSLNKTASFTAPASGAALRFRSRVQGGVGTDGQTRSDYTTTFNIYTLSSGGFRSIAADETTEGDHTFGWITVINDLVRAGGITSPGGSNTQLQYNNSGGFGGATNLTYVSGFLTIATDLKLTNSGFTSRLSAGTLGSSITITLPAATCTLVGKDTTDTLTNKTISGASNTLTVRLANDITGFGTGVATFLATPSSSNLASAITDETGSGALVFGTAPLFKTTINLNNPGNTFKYVITPAAIAADRTLTLPLLAGNDTAVCEAFAQTLTNKTVAAGSNTVSGFIDPGLCGLRLTLTSGTAVTTTDVTGATTIYFTPFRSGAISLWDGAQWVVYTTAEISLALGTLTSGKNYDVFCYQNSGTPTLELSAAWTNDTTRADALTTQNGVLVKSGAVTRKLVGTFRTTSTTATADAYLTRYVSNLYNSVPRTLKVTDTTDSWTYVNPNAVWRQANASSANKFEFVACEVRHLTARAYCTGSAASTSALAVGIGIDSTSSNSAFTRTGRSNAAGDNVTMVAEYDDPPALGYHAVNWLETGTSGAITYTFFGDQGTTLMQSGLVGVIAA